MKNEQNKKQKVKSGDVLITLISLLLGAVIGFITIEYIEKRRFLISEDLRPFRLLIMMLALALSSVVHTVIHEAGHLVFGLLSGYRFSSFRIFSFAWVKENGKIKFRRFKVAGTGGQCLMIPPDLVDGKIPVKLYNFGGVIFNILASLLAVVIFIVSDHVLVCAICLIFALLGLTYACMNGIPMRMSTVNNDGYNAFSVGKDPEAIRALWIQLKASEQTAQGVRLKDMPDEWFVLPSDESMKNSIIATIAVFASSRLIDEKKFEEADALIHHLLEIDNGIVELHRKLMICDLLYLELIGQNRPEIIEEWLTKEQLQFMKSMKKLPTVVRTEYTHALLFKKDVEKANALKAQFEKLAKRYPYQSDIDSERELMEIAENK